MKSKVTILITAWARHIKRVEYLRNVLISISENLILDDINPEFIISAETQEAKFQNRLTDLCKEFHYKLLLHPGPANLGANLNFAHKNIHTDFIIYVQDDFLMLKKHNPIDEVEFISKYPQYDLVYYVRRFWNEKYHKTETPNKRYLEISKDNSNYYSDNAHFKKGNFHDNRPFSEDPGCERSMHDICRKDRSVNLCTRIENDDIAIFQHSGGAIPSMLEKYVRRGTITQQRVNEIINATE